MGLLKKLFQSKSIPEEALSAEDRRRMGERASRMEEKPVSEMSEDEKLNY